LIFFFDFFFLTNFRLVAVAHHLPFYLLFLFTTGALYRTRVLSTALNGAGHVRLAAENGGDDSQSPAVRVGVHYY
jgi:hypothetical protein